jgi:uncharacterized protein
VGVVSRACRESGQLTRWPICVDAGSCSTRSTRAAPWQGRIDAATLRSAVGSADALCSQLSTLGLDHELAHNAGDLVETHRLRGYDAVHLATALSSDSDSLLLATWDRELARAAIEAGCSVSPPPTA